MDQSPNPEVNVALIGFSEESILYCRGINDSVAREYAEDYIRMIEQRLRGEEYHPPRIRHQLFAPSRRLICSTLEKMCDRHFPSKSNGGAG